MIRNQSHCYVIYYTANALLFLIIIKVWSWLLLGPIMKQLIIDLIYTQ